MRVPSRAPGALLATAHRCRLVHRILALPVRVDTPSGSKKICICIAFGCVCVCVGVCGWCGENANLYDLCCIP